MNFVEIQYALEALGSLSTGVPPTKFDFNHTEEMRRTGLFASWPSFGFSSINLKSSLGIVRQDRKATLSPNCMIVGFEPTKNANKKRLTPDPVFDLT